MDTKVNMKSYNDKVTVVSTPKIWARKLYKSAQKKSIWSTFNPHSGPATFTKKDIKRWWNHRRLNEPRMLVNPREQAKKELSAWFSNKYDEHLIKKLSKEELPNVGTTSNTKQTSNNWSCSPFL